MAAALSASIMVLTAGFSPGSAQHNVYAFLLGMCSIAATVHNGSQGVGQSESSFTFEHSYRLASLEISRGFLASRVTATGASTESHI
jgi:hypothetical protein